MSHIFAGHTVAIGDIVTLEHPDGSRLVREALESESGGDERVTIAPVGIEKARHRPFLQYLLDVGWVVKNVKHTQYEPFAAYVDKYGHDVWVTDGNSNLRCLSAQSANEDKYAPFTRLVPEP